MSGRSVLVRAALLALIACLLAGEGSQGRGAEQGEVPAGSKLPLPHLFTLEANRMPLGKVLDELGRQTGVRVEAIPGLREQMIDVALSKTTFWSALDRIAHSAGARVYLYPRSGRITLVERTPGSEQPPTCYDGLFRIRVSRVAASRDLESPTAVYTATLEVAWEPELQPLLLETWPRGLRVEDDHNRPVSGVPEGSSEAPVDGRFALAFDMALPVLPRSCGHIGLLEGQLAAVAPSKMLKFTFGSPEQLAQGGPGTPGRRQVQEGVVCTVRKVTLTPERWSVQVALNYPPGGKTLESYQSWVVNNEMVLESKDGRRRLASSGYVLDNASARRAEITYHFLDKGGRKRGRPEDWRLTYRTPAALVEMPIRFSFKDVPLP